MATMPHITVLTATRNRAAALRRFLQALPAEDFVSAHAELVVVDNGSTDETPDILASFSRGVTWPVRVLQEPHAGKSLALNRGLRHSTAPLIVFTDDDCYLQPGYLSQVHRVFEDRGIGFCGGKILLHDATDAYYTVDYREAPRRYPPGTAFAPGSFQGANLVVRRAVVEAIGGFDPELGAGVRYRGEDLDFCYRASLAGFAGAYAPELIVHHHHQRKPGPELRRLRALDQRSCGAVYAKLMHLRFGCFAKRWLLDAGRLARRGRTRAALNMIRGTIDYLARTRRRPTLVIPLTTSGEAHERCGEAGCGDRS